MTDTAEKTVEHTPLPLRVVSMYDGGVLVVDKNNDNFAFCVGKNIAAFLVKACNSHDDLVAALQKIHDIAHGSPRRSIRLTGICNVALGALAKTKEGEA